MADARRSFAEELPLPTQERHIRCPRHAAKRIGEVKIILGERFLQYERSR
jgi:hypothetical protein